jgi:hypothetical protein
MRMPCFADLQGRDIEQAIMDMPYASHILDVYTSCCADKRAHLLGGYQSLRRSYASLSGDADYSDTNEAPCMRRRTE